MTKAKGCEDVDFPNGEQAGLFDGAQSVQGIVVDARLTLSGEGMKRHDRFRALLGVLELGILSAKIVRRINPQLE